MGTRNRKNAAAAALCTGVIGNVIWGSSYLFTRIAQNESSPMVQLAWRFALAFLLLNLMILFGWEKLHLRGKKLKPLILLSVVEPLYFFCESYGIYYSNSTFSGVMLAIVPIIAIGLGTLILKEYPTAKQVLLCLLPIAGVVLVTIAGSRMGAVQPLGVLLVLGACLFAAFYRVYNKGAAAEFTALRSGVCSGGAGGRPGRSRAVCGGAAQQKICHGHHFSQRVLLCGCQYSGKLQRIRVAHGNFFQPG